MTRRVWLAAGLIALPALAAGAAPRFEDRAGGLPVAHVYQGGWEHFVGGGVAILDCNADARPDLFVAGGTGPARLFVNATPPGGAIRFVAGEIVPLTGVTGAYPLDLDADGTRDLMVLRAGPDVALLGQGDCRFAEGTDALGLAPGDDWTTAFSATWEAGAARPTLAFGSYVDRADPEGPFGACGTNWLVRPDARGYGPRQALEPGYCPLSMLFSDWRRTGTPLLRISNDRHYYLDDGHEQMWQLDPLRAWDARDAWPEQKLWGMGIASADLTGDGLPEVMLTSMGDQVLMRNLGGGFEAVPYATGTYAQRPHTGEDGRPSTGWHAEFGDIDNDGRLDLFIAKGNVDQMPGLAIDDPNNLLMQGADGTFSEAAGAAGIATTERARGAGLVDLNADGRLDLVVANRRAPLEVWQNATDATGSWLAVAPRQPGPNAFALGAWIEVRAGGRVQAREITVGGGHAGGQAGPVHFGLGDASAAEVRVIWPDGTVGAWQAVEVDRVIRIARPRD